MTSKKLLTVVGTRPQFIKVASVSRILPSSFSEVLVNTGQHYDHNMSQTFFDELQIPAPKYNLKVGSDTHAKQTAKILERLEPIMIDEKPDAVLLYGDTNSTLGAALCAAKLQIPIVHVECGMRSRNKIPEEFNRKLTDHMSDLLFCSDKPSMENLAKENITENVHLVGDLMIDALAHQKTSIEKNKGILETYGLKEKGYVLVTIHRPENTDSQEILTRLVTTLISSQKRMVFVLHPRTMSCLKQYNLLHHFDAEHVTLVEALPYLDMITLEYYAGKLATDSGGMQKEAYFFHVPCIYLRDRTEWPATVEEKFNVLVSTDKKKILHALENFTCPSKNSFAYGKGDAAERIIKVLQKWTLN